MPRRELTEDELSANGNEAKNGDNGSRLLQRGLDILEQLAQADQPVASNVLAERLNLHPATCHRLLMVLKTRGYARQDDKTKQWSLGVAVFRLGAAVFRNTDLRPLARPAMEELCRKTNETVFLGVLDRGEVVYIDKVESRQAVAIAISIGMHLRMHATALGRVLLAFGEPHLLEEELGRGLQALTRYTLTDPQKLREEIARIRREGHAIQHQETFEGVCTVAAPIFDFQGKTVAAIGIAGPDNRLSNVKLEQFAVEVKEAARAISVQLGYVPEDGF
jgi:DNA-binding IclR family transcriptional regulator